MPEVTAKTPIGAAIQAARQEIKRSASASDITGADNRRPDVKEVTDQAAPKEVTNAGDEQRFLALARQQKALRAEQRKFLEDKARWEAEKNQSQVNPAELRAKFEAEMRDRIAEDPLAVMSEFGAKLQALQESQTTAQSLLAKQKQEAEESARKQIRSNVKILVESDPSYEATKSLNAENAVEELVYLSIQEGEELSIKEAALQVETYLVDEALKAAAIPKIKSKLTPAEKLEAAMEETTQEVTPRQTSLSNQGISATGKLTDKQRRQRAIWAGMGLDPDTGKPRA